MRMPLPVFAVAAAFFSLGLLQCGVSSEPTNTGSTVMNATVRDLWVLNLSLQHPEIVVPEDYYFYQNLSVFHSSILDKSVYLNKSDASGFVKFVNQTEGGTYYQDDYAVLVPEGARANVTLRVYVPPGQGYADGTYDIPFYATSLEGNASNATGGSASLRIHVNDTNPIDDIQITGLYPSALYQGETLDADVSIHKITPQELTDVQLCYCINKDSGYMCGPSYNNYGCEWKAVQEWLNYTKKAVVNEAPGEYYFIVSVKYPGDEDIKRAVSPKFLVKSVQPPSGGPSGGPAGFAPAPSQPKLTVTAPDYLETAPGKRLVFNATVKNTGNAVASNTTLSVYGVQESWVSITPPARNISAGGEENYSVSINVPSSAAEQAYHLSLLAKSGSAEATKAVTMTVASDLRDTARLLLEEAASKKGEAEGIIKDVKDFGMDASAPEKNLADGDVLFGQAGGLFDSGNYSGSIEKAKQAIEGYNQAIDAAKDIVEKAYLLLLGEVTSGVAKLEPSAEDKDVIESINRKVNESETLHREERVVEAHKTLLEAKQLLDQLWGKIYLRGLIQNLIILSVLAVVFLVVFMLVFHKKRMSKVIKSMKLEEHKKNLTYLFRKEVKPDTSYKETVPGPVREKMEEIGRLLEIGEALVDTDLWGAKEAYDNAKKIYNSLTPEERKLLTAESLRFTMLYNKIAGRSR